MNIINIVASGSSLIWTYSIFKEISKSRKELKLASQTLSSDQIRNGFASYEAYISSKNYYPVFYLNFGSNSLIIANNILLDNTKTKYEILINLYSIKDVSKNN